MKLQRTALEFDITSKPRKSRWKVFFWVIVLLFFGYRFIFGETQSEVIVKLNASYKIDQIESIKNNMTSWPELEGKTVEIAPIREYFTREKANTTHYVKLIFQESVDLNLLIPKIESRGDVKYAEENRQVKQVKEPKPRFKDYLFNDGTGLLIDTDVQHLMNIPLKDEVVVAVLDTGLDLTHPVVEDSLWVNEGEIAGNGIDDDGNGYNGDIHGWEFINNFPISHDDGSHGTMVSSVICGKYNPENQFSGVNSGIKIMAINNGTNFEHFSLAIRYAVDMGADVINMSFGTQVKATIFEEAVAYAKSNKVVVVAAAGNDGDKTKNYPAIFSEVISVGATERDLETGNQFISSYSTYGDHVDIATYGGLFLVATPVERGEYMLNRGTSLSTPIISSMAAILKSYNKDITSDEAKAVLLLYAVPFSDTEIKKTKYGYLDLKAFSERYIKTETTMIKAIHKEDSYYVEVDVVKSKETGEVLKVIARKLLKERYDTNRVISLNEEIFE